MYSFCTIDGDSNNLTIIDRDNLVHSNGRDNINLTVNTSKIKASKNDKIINVFTKLNNFNAVETIIFKHCIAIYCDNVFTDDLYKITLDLKTKMAIAKQINVSISTMNRAVSTLIIKGVLSKYDNTNNETYFINPRYDISNYISESAQYITIKL